MKKLNILKLAGLMVLVISFAVGCASTEDKQEAGKAEAAIAAAKAANDKAKAEGYEWRDTGKIIESAEKALKEGKDEEAIKLANKAKSQAELAVAQKQEELQRLQNNGILPVAVAEGVSVSEDTYTVVRGDNLWNIAAKPSIYSNPYHWPLIYKANSNKIKDPDLIYPNQVFDIKGDYTVTEMEAAVYHAKNRGTWSINGVEEVDKVYLSK
ncbi:MAG: LysM peptidoglycan-binding domain-containing protein [Proteobacteria bacterium]|jgi:nucleoid-associated protein YgaU|nr:LysM peptidoglycan-binding domain-containing protein [Pseudomonadota bacterium]MCG6936333.1 LysM peptidoglycan-binding domain-containing protein [Pseudomonadota bacterium]